MLKEKPAIIVGGPARILELIRLKKLKTGAISMVVLDETDRMLAPEMRDILRDLLSVLPGEAQYVACSATLSNYHASLVENMIPASKNESAETGREKIPDKNREPSARRRAQTQHNALGLLLRRTRKN